MTEVTTARFLLLAPEKEARETWKARLTPFGSVRATRTAESARREVDRARAGYTALIIDVDVDTRPVQRLLQAMHRQSPAAPLLLITEDAPRAAKLLASLGVRVALREAALEEARYFIGASVALAQTENPAIAQAIEGLARNHEMTVKQMQLTALSTTDIDREALIDGLGVSQNTVKTRIRHLLRMHEVETLDGLGKRVLRDALTHA
jgi:DNA-binding NtrC family response regulator